MNELKITIITDDKLPIPYLACNNFKVEGYEVCCVVETIAGHYELYLTNKKTAISKLFSKLASIFTRVIPK